MERRNVLLGCGTALTTVLAGCAGSDLTSDDESSSDSNEKGDTKKRDDGDDHNKEDGYDKDHDEDMDDDDDKEQIQDIPGVDMAEFEAVLERQGISLETVHRKGSNLLIEVSFDDLDTEGLSLSTVGQGNFEERLLEMAREMNDAVTDPQRFVSEIETVAVVVLDDKGKPGLTVEVRVSWLLQFMREELDADEFLDRILNGNDDTGDNGDEDG